MYECNNNNSNGFATEIDDKVTIAVFLLLLYMHLPMCTGEEDAYVHMGREDERTTFMRVVTEMTTETHLLTERDTRQKQL